MDYRSLFQTTVRILHQNKLIWLFSLVNPLSNYFWVLIKNLSVFSCFLSSIGAYLLLVGGLGVLIILYHGYLGQTVNFRELWKEINSYFIKVVGIFILSGILFVIPFGLLYLILRRSPYIISEVVMGIPRVYFFTFLITYFLLGMIRNKLDIKYAAEVWSYNRGAKLIIAILFTFAQILFNFLLPAIIQKGFSISILGIGYQEISAMNNLLMSRILQGFYSWIITPIITAIVVSFYFMDIEAKEGVPQNVPQLV